jgi:hypothetical protein
MPTLNRFPADQDPASKTKTKRKRRVLEPIDLKNVPDQPLILKNAISQNYEDNSRRRPVKEGKSSRYAGIYFDDKLNKWKAQMMINREVRSLGYHDSEEAAAAIYAKAAFKYKTKKANQTTFGGMDLGNVPAQSLLRNERASSGYKGVKKSKNGRWEARIGTKSLGTFDTAEEAAGIYARADYYIKTQVSVPVFSVAV